MEVEDYHIGLHHVSGSERSHACQSVRQGTLAFAHLL